MDGWKILQNAMKCFLTGKGYEEKDGYFFDAVDNRKSFFVLPLAEIMELREKRKMDYGSHVIFLISGESEDPMTVNRNNKMIKKGHLGSLFGNPEFGKIEKAILEGELIHDEQFVNVVDASLPGFKNNLMAAIDWITSDRIKKLSTDYAIYRSKFYETFVNYYWPEGGNERIDLSEVSLLSSRLSDSPVFIGIKEDDKKVVDDIVTHMGSHKLESFLQVSDVLYCYLNNINYNDRTHRVRYELFRAPVPFPLEELIDAKKSIEGGLKNKIRLLLIDNKIDKIPTLNEIIKTFGLERIITVEAIGGKSAEDVVSFKEDLEKFNYMHFGPDKGRLLSNWEKEYYNNGNITTYSDVIYDKIMSAHFVLLDFFLNEENTYLAFDFIKEISDMKRKRGNYSTTWFFVASAVYDSVVKYSQSGLLAEFYESAVVSAGDDPTNEKRQIIFVYKLLTFIKSRLKNFESMKDVIERRALATIDSSKNSCCSKCPGNDALSNECGREECLEEMQSTIKRYLTEYDNISAVFYQYPDDRQRGEYKKVIERLDGIIRQFRWLPEADWQMIQHQIEYINAKLSTLQDGSKRKFSCNYINNEIERRAQIY